jgi:hypothetical protein
MNIIGGTTLQPSTTPNTTTTPGNGISTPLPTQTGIVSNCDAFYKVIQGDNCASIAAANGITLQSFYDWNAGVGTTCSALWLDVSAPSLSF